MIPKVIHYCWFGGKPLPELAEKCIVSWKKKLPEYEIVRWDETKFDINSNRYVQEAYESGKYAFVTDYVRLYALYTQGGIYMDTDVEVLKPLDQFLHLNAFSGFESYHDIPTGIMAAEKGFEGIRNLLMYYENRHFIKSDGSLDMTTNVVIITKYYTERGLKRNNTLQTVEKFTFYPRIWFCPNKDDIEERREEIYTVHHMAGSWLSKKERKKKHNILTKIKRSLALGIKELVGREKYDKLRNLFQ